MEGNNELPLLFDTWEKKLWIRKKKYGIKNWTPKQIENFIGEKYGKKPRGAWIISRAGKMAFGNEKIATGNEKAKRAPKTYEDDEVIRLCTEWDLERIDIQKNDKTLSRRPHSNFKKHCEAVRNFRKQNLWSKKVEIGIKRVERIIVSRILGFIASSLSLKDILTSDWFIIAGFSNNQKCVNGLSFLAEELDLKSLVDAFKVDQEPQDSVFHFALTSERGEVFLIKDKPEETLDDRNYLRFEFVLKENQEKAIILVIGPPKLESLLLSEIKKRVQDSVSELESRPFFQLLKSVLIYWEKAKKDLEDISMMPIKVDTKRQSQNPLQLPNILLMAFAKMITNMVYSNTSLSCFCDIFIEKEQSERGKRERRYLKVLASSESFPWDLNAKIAQIPSGQFLSGAAFAANSGLFVKDTASALSKKLISYYDEERVGAGYAFPALNPENARPNGVIYIGFFNTTEEVNKVEGFAKYFLCAKILSLCAGELVQRQILAENTILTGYRMADYNKILLDEKEFCTKIVDVLHNPASDDSSFMRVPVILFSAMELKKTENSREVSKWLSEQLALINFKSDLLPYIKITGTDPNKLLAAMIGEPSKGYPFALAVLIPEFVKRDRIRLLREVPTERNSLPPLSTGDGSVEVRVGAWVLDFDRNSISGFGKKPEKIVFNKLRRWIKVAPSLVKAYECAHWSKSGGGAQWREALKAAQSGLTEDPKHPYLLRRCCEFALALGNLEGALDYATKAVNSDKTHIRSGCLLGDVFLASAKATKAVEQYIKVIEKNAEHPFGYYSAGLALMTIAQVLRDWLIDSFRKTDFNGGLNTALDCGPLISVPKSIRQIDILLDYAKRLCKKSEDKFDVLDYEARVHYQEEYYGPVYSFAIAESTLLRGKTKDSIDDFFEYREKYPEDENISRGLIRARLSELGIPQRLVEQLPSIVKAVKKIPGLG